ncbi:MAG TPA: hypothetical protein VHB21_19385 [Minicystis sp.]|nr:hypothetical protein [Minicystis sp.]
MDDDAPRTLQPFLQRASSVRASFAGGTLRTVGPALGHGAFTDANLDGGAAFDLYVLRWLVLGASFDYQYDVTTLRERGVHDAQTTNTLAPAGSVGVRFGDTRIDVIYRYRAPLVHGSVQFPQWGVLTAQVESVLAKRRLGLFVTASAFDSGAGLTADIEGFFTKDLSLYAGGYGSADAHDDAGTPHDDYGGRAGVAVWVAPRLRLVAEYEISGADVTPAPVGGADFAYTELRNAVSVSVLARLP